VKPEIEERWCSHVVGVSNQSVGNILDDFKAKKSLGLCLDVCIGKLGIAFGVISTSWDICIEINTIIWVSRIDILVECQILFGWSK
jgi:hypothetical protein